MTAYLQEVRPAASKGTEELRLENLVNADPIVTANLYAASRLDEIVTYVVRPVWTEVRVRAVGPSGLWVVRYGRGGEHLKIRLHGPKPLGKEFKCRLSQVAEVYFASSKAPETRSSRARWRKALPIDEEDRVSEDYPDRTLLWTNYQRSPVSFGSGLWVEDDCYVARICTCLAAGFETLLATLNEAGETGFSSRLRRSTLLDAILAVIAGLSLSERERCSYFGYHRDWLLRIAAIQSRQRPKDILVQLDRQIDVSGAPLESLRQVAAEEWARPRETVVGQPSTRCRLRTAAADLACYLRQAGSGPEYQIDPFTTEPVFSAGFKILHGIANQAGLDLLNEALIYQIVFRAIAETHPALSAVQLMP